MLFCCKYCGRCMSLFSITKKPPLEWGYKIIFFMTQHLRTIDEINVHATMLEFCVYITCRPSIT